MENTLKKLTEQLDILFGQTGLQLAFWQLRNNAETLNIDVNQFYAIISEGEKLGVLHRDLAYNFTYTPRVVAAVTEDVVNN